MVTADFGKVKAHAQRTTERKLDVFLAISKSGISQVQSRDFRDKITAGIPGSDSGSGIVFSIHQQLLFTVVHRYTYVYTHGVHVTARLDPCELRTVVPYTYTLSERSAEVHVISEAIHARGQLIAAAVDCISKLRIKKIRASTSRLRRVFVRPARARALIVFRQVHVCDVDLCSLVVDMTCRLFGYLAATKPQKISLMSFIRFYDACKSRRGSESNNAKRYERTYPTVARRLIQFTPRRSARIVACLFNRAGTRSPPRPRRRRPGPRPPRAAARLDYPPDS
ncbi:hypothetical protein EVAR_21188_1 [Eumeta japonica]|uniref:Uncharacterized protein n=1 Tax=Eumeta variegata TaxID=151549 RepID=A0A4C1UNM4_EUMVA|nr:hypothetical protein EVAR_21188_1 [Eumeta japonica]